MELKDDPKFQGLFAQVQVLDMVLMAVVKSHPDPTELIAEIEEQLGLLRSLSQSRATDLMGRLAHAKFDQTAQGWLDYARQQLPED